MSLHFYKSILIVTVFQIGINSYGQNISFNHYTRNNGLSDDIVYRIYQDKKTGFLWLGTNNGLSRFDGYQFTSFQYKGLIDRNYILSIAPYNNDTLLLSYYREGWFLFSNGQIYPYKKVDSLHAKRTISIVSDKGENFFFIDSKELFYLSGETTRKLDFKENYPRPEKGYPIIKNQNGQIYIGTTNGLVEFNDFEVKSVWSNQLSGHTINNGAFDKQGNFWYGEQNKIFNLKNNESFKKEVVALPDDSFITRIEIDSKGWIWAFTEAGDLFLYREGKLLDMDKILKLNGTMVNDMIEDQDNNIWLATYGKGIFQLLLSSNYVSYKLGDKQENFFRALYQSSDGTIWAGGRGAVFFLKEGEWYKYQPSQLAKQEFVNSITQNSQEQLYIGTTQALYLFDDDSIVCLNSDHSARSLEWSIDSNLLIGTYAGCFEIKDCNTTDSIFKNLISTTINHLKYDKHQNLWIASYKGALQLKKDSVIHHYTTRDGLLSNKVNRIAVDHLNHVWLATDRGINRYDGKQWYSYKLSEPYSKHNCTSITSGKTGRIWVGTSGGLFYIDEEGKDLRSYTDIGNSNIYSLATDSAGNIWAGTLNAMICINDRINKEELPLNSNPVSITEVRTKDTVFNKAAHVKLPFKNNRLILQFTVPFFKNPDRLRFYYKWSDSDRWIETNQRYLEFNSLPPGKHSLLLSYSISPSQKLSKPKEYSFSVFTPVWLRPWFLATAALLVIYLIYYTSRYRLKEKHLDNLRENEVQKQITSLKHQALNAMMNPHFITNALTSIENFSYTHDKIQTGKYISDFSRLIRLNLINADQSYIPLDQEISRLETYLSLEQLRFENKFSYSIEKQLLEGPEIIEIPNMIVQPFVENAIIHGLLPSGKDGCVKVSFLQKTQDSLEINIEDNGGGIEVSRLSNLSRSSKGIKLTQERLRLSGQERPVEITNITCEGKRGTRVRIKINLE